MFPLVQFVLGSCVAVCQHWQQVSICGGILLPNARQWRCCGCFAAYLVACFALLWGNPNSLCAQSHAHCVGGASLALYACAKQRLLYTCTQCWCAWWAGRVPLAGHPFHRRLSVLVCESVFRIPLVCSACCVELLHGRCGLWLITGV